MERRPDGKKGGGIGLPGRGMELGPGGLKGKGLRMKGGMDRMQRQFGQGRYKRRIGWVQRIELFLRMKRGEAGHRRRNSPYRRPRHRAERGKGGRKARERFGWIR